MNATLCESIPAQVLHQEISGIGLKHVLTVPDTWQRTLMASLARDPEITTHRFSAEHEAIACNAGMWMGGMDALVLIQNTGFFASTNALRGIAIDLKVPTFMLVGQYGHDMKIPVEEDRNTAVRLLKPVLEAMKVPYYVIDYAGDAKVMPEAYAQSRKDRTPVVCIVTGVTA